MLQSIDHMVRFWARDRPERPAVIQRHERLTYGELDAWVGRVAAEFAGLGLAPGDRICIFAANGIRWCVAALAALRAGAIVSGLNTRMVTHEIAWLLGDYAPRILMVDAAGAECAATIGSLLSRDGAPVAAPAIVTESRIDALRDAPPADVHVDIHPDSPATIVTTSGSTARPKGVVYSHRAMIEHATAWSLEDPVGPDGHNILIVAPLSTSAGSVQFILAMTHGGTIHLEDRFEADRALALIERERINMLCGAPIFFQRMADSPLFAAADVSTLRITYTGGAAVAVKLLRAWADRGVFVRQMYGQSECGGNGTVNSRRHALSHPDKCGSGGAQRAIRVVDAIGAPVPAGVHGQILLRCAGMMQGYWNNPEATREALIDGWLHTGDIGVIDELGLLEFIDRAKDIIISGGNNISAAEVERVILEMPGVEEVAVIAAPDQTFGETPFAIVHGVGLSIPAIVAHCDRHLTAYKVPRYMVVRDEPLPRLATGKIAKPALRAAYPAPAETLPRVR